MEFDDFKISFQVVLNPSRGITDPQITQINVTANHMRLPVVGGIFQTHATMNYFDAQQAHELQETYHQALKQAQELHQELQADGISRMPAIERSFEIGQKIAAMLPPNLRASIIQASLHAQQHRRMLRIILDFYSNASTLLQIPWELLVLSINDLHEPTIEDFLLLKPWVTIVRQIREVGVVIPTTFVSPLALEVCVAEPAGVAPINLVPIQASFQSLSAWQDDCWYAGAGTIEHLFKRLTARQPAILHLVCHGDPSEIQQGVRYDLLLTHAQGFIRRAGAAELGPILNASQNLRLVVLHACYGGIQTQSLADQRVAIEGVALGLLRRGIPLVMAFQGEVSQDAAVAFTRTFYQQLEMGIPVEMAMTHARMAIHAEVPRSLLDWSLPILYRGSEELNFSQRANRFADWLEVRIKSPTFQRNVWGGMSILAVLLVFLALLRIFVLPSLSVTQLGHDLIQQLWIITLMGILAPAVIAITDRTTYRTQRLKSKARRQVIVTQWVAAYLGYSVGYLSALLLYACLFLLFGQALTALFWQVSLIVGMLGLALGYSYLGMRVQVRSAWALAESSPELFSYKMLFTMLWSATLIILGIPYLAHQLLVTNATILQAGPLAFVLSTGLLSFVVLFSD